MRQFLYSVSHRSEDNEYTAISETVALLIRIHQVLLRKSASRAVVPREGAESRDRMMDVAYFMDPADKPRDDNISE